MQKLWILLAATILSSCAYPVPVKLDLPPEITYPTIKEQELRCLSDKTYEALVIRDQLKSARIKTLTNIIKATQ